MNIRCSGFNNIISTASEVAHTNLKSALTFAKNHKLAVSATALTIGSTAALYFYGEDLTKFCFPISKIKDSSEPTFPKQTEAYISALGNFDINESQDSKSWTRKTVEMGFCTYNLIKLSNGFGYMTPLYAAPLLGNILVAKDVSIIGYCAYSSL